MSIQSIIRIGAHSLRQVSEPVDPEKITGLEIQTIIQNMIDTMHHYNGAGIAAPQIGINKRIIIFGFDKNPRYPQAKPVPFTILINPEFEICNTNMEEAYEGCLSLGELRGKVPRYIHIRYWGLDEKGQKIEREVENFHARVVQHEIDHIDGVLFVDRISDMRSLGFTTELEREGLIPLVVKNPE